MSYNTKDDVNTKLDKIWNKLESVSSDISSIKNEVEDLKADNKKLQSDMEKIKNCQEKTDGKNEQAIKHIQDLERTVYNLQSTIRERNIVLFGLEDNVDINKNIVNEIKNIFTKADINLAEEAIEHAFRIGKNIGNRPTLIKFASIYWTKIVFSKIKKSRI